MVSLSRLYNKFIYVYNQKSAHARDSWIHEIREIREIREQKQENPFCRIIFLMDKYYTIYILNTIVY